MQQSANRKVIVIGAGVGGLATAIALRQAGIDVAVYERATEREKLQVGSGIHLWQNAVRALQQLEVADRVEAVGEVVERMEWRKSGGGFIAAWRVGELSRELGAPAVGISRADLYAALAGALDEGTVRTGTECVGFDQDDQGVTVRFADGREEHGDVLVGADGVNSLVRTSLYGKTEPRFAGYTLYHAVVRSDQQPVPPYLFREAWGHGKRFGFYPVKGKTFWFGMFKGPRVTSNTEPNQKATCLELYKDWLVPTEKLIEVTPEEDISHINIYGQKPLKQWSTGRVTILGDAAHAMTPNLGQGACQAIEDAVVLAKCLRAEPDVAAALRSYEQQRMGRTASIQTRAWWIGSSGRWSNPLAVAVRDRIMGVVFPTLAWNQQKKDMAFQF
jgi:2-polyprenyl-6-methoxyphenol hydroxylase-like FAD-dependent oxidoreductase